MRAIALLSGLVAICLSAAPRANALSANQLTPQEQRIYAGLNGDQTSQQNFLITREYVRKAHDVVSGKLSPDQLPDQPDEFDSRYLLPGDSTTPKKAIKLSLSAYIDSHQTA